MRNSNAGPTGPTGPAATAYSLNLFMLLSLVPREGFEPISLRVRSAWLCPVKLPGYT